MPRPVANDIAHARRRLAQASTRRKSLEPPIGNEDANRMAGLNSNLENRKRPQMGMLVNDHAGYKPQDGIYGAKQYLGSEGGESVGQSIGSAAGNSNVVPIGRSRLGNDGKNYGSPTDEFDYSKLPAHLQKSLDLIKRRKLDASARKKKQAIDLTGLQRMKDRDYDPRRLMH